MQCPLKNKGGFLIEIFYTLHSCFQNKAGYQRENLYLHVN